MTLKDEYSVDRQGKGLDLLTTAGNRKEVLASSSLTVFLQ